MIGSALLVVLLTAAPDGGAPPSEAPNVGWRLYEPPTIPEPDRHPKGRLSFDRPSVGPGLEAKAVEAFVKSRSAPLLACYERMLRSVPSLAGAVVLRFQVTPAGRVTELEVAPDLGSSDFASCLKAYLRGWVFTEKPEAETPVAIRITFERQR